MCDGKYRGGYGFKELNRVNLALLAKLGWRLLAELDILWARVITGLYYPNGNCLNAKFGSMASWGWQSILVGKGTLCRGLRKQVGDGCQTKIWGDPWIPSFPSRKILHPKPQSSLIWVADLKVGKQWNDKILR